MGEGPLLPQALTLLSASCHELSCWAPHDPRSCTAQSPSGSGIGFRDQDYSSLLFLPLY